MRPAETSIKTEKQQDNTSAIKYIKIGRDQLPPLTNEIIDINEPARQDKRLSWADESKRPDESNNSSSIFSKLKIKSPSPIHTDIQSETQMEILPNKFLVSMGSMSYIYYFFIICYTILGNRIVSIKYLAFSIPNFAFNTL